MKMLLLLFITVVVGQRINLIGDFPYQFLTVSNGIWFAYDAEVGMARKSLDLGKTWTLVTGSNGMNQGCPWGIYGQNGYITGNINGYTYLNIGSYPGAMDCESLQYRVQASAVINNGQLSTTQGITCWVQSSSISYVNYYILDNLGTAYNPQCGIAAVDIAFILTTPQVTLTVTTTGLGYNYFPPTNSRPALFTANPTLYSVATDSLGQTVVAIDNTTVSIVVVHGLT